MLRRFLATLLLTAALAAPAKAEMQTYQFDKTHTQILFFVEHMGFSHSNGKFLKFDGDFKFDPANPATGSVQVTIDTNSLDMDDATWDEHMKAKDMLNVEEFPTMTFKSTNVMVPGAPVAPGTPGAPPVAETANNKVAVLTGDLTLLGVTKPVMLSVTLNKCGEHPFNKKQTCGFDAIGKIKRSDFGMTKGIPMVGDEVKIMITVEASVGDAVNQ